MSSSSNQRQSQNSVDLLKSLVEKLNIPSGRPLLGPFDGENDEISIETWLRLYEEDEPKETRLSQLPRYLTGKALTLFDRYISRVSMDWAVIRKELIRAFNKPMPDSLDYQGLRLTRLTTVVEYFLEKRYILSLNPRLTEEQIVHHLTKGLPRSWKTYPIIINAKTVDQWFEAARQLEIVYSTPGFFRLKKNRAKIFGRSDGRRPRSFDSDVAYLHNLMNCRKSDPNGHKDENQTSSQFSNNQECPTNNGGQQRKPCKYCVREAAKKVYHPVDQCPFSPDAPDISQTGSEDWEDFLSESEESSGWSEEEMNSSSTSSSQGSVIQRSIKTDEQNEATDDSSDESYKPDRRRSSRRE